MQNESQFAEMALMELGYMERSVERQKASLVKNIKDLYDYVFVYEKAANSLDVNKVLNKINSLLLQSKDIIKSEASVEGFRRAIGLYEEIKGEDQHENT